MKGRVPDRRLTSLRFTPFVVGAPGCPHPTKKGYDTRAAAKRVARRFRGRSDVAKQVAYLCVCGFFHLGHSPKGMHRDEHRGAS